MNDTVDGLEFFDENSENEDEEMDGDEDALAGKGWEGWQVDRNENDSDSDDEKVEKDDITKENDQVPELMDDEAPELIDEDAMIDDIQDKRDNPLIEVSLVEKKATARQMAMERILTDEDFARLRKIKAKKEAERLAGTKGNKLTLKDLEEEDSDDAEK